MAERIEYQDAQGRVHRVKDLQEVPKQYMPSVLIEDEGEGAAASGSWKPDPRAFLEAVRKNPGNVEALGDALRGAQPQLFAPIVLAVAWYKFRDNFVIKVLIGFTAIFWGMFYGYGYVERLIKADDKKPAGRHAPARALDVTF